jgi:Golgi SNAP receptor complex protein 1
LARVRCGLKADVEGFPDGQLKETVEEMAALLNDPENPPTQSMLHAVQRHRDVLEDYKVDFKRTKARVCLLWDIAH